MQRALSYQFLDRLQESAISYLNALQLMPTDLNSNMNIGLVYLALAALAVIALSLDRNAAGVLAALTAGGALGFLRHGFPPASSFMGDTGSNLLGFLLACVAIQGALKTNAVVALFFPLIILAVPILDTGFVVAKRVKYRQPIYKADRWHFHHRMANIGFSQRRTLAYMYGWTATMAVLALAYVMNQSAQTLTIGNWIAGAGGVLAFFSSIIGWLGVAVTGSDTSSNSLFGALQVQAAKEAGLDPTLLAAANSSGGVLGKMISPQNLAIGAAAVGLAGQEGELFRRVLGWSLALLLIMCVIVLLQSTAVLSWMVV